MIFRTSESKILKIISKNKFENIKILKNVEKILYSLRGYSFKIPKKNSDVILLLSGGIDSIISWAILIKEFGLRVHPVCINTNQKRHIQELKSIRYFSYFFKNKYPNLFINPFEITFPTSTPEISRQLRGNLIKNIHPEVLKKNFNPLTNNINLQRKYLFPAYFPYPAALSALFFDLKKNLKIRTIFTGILPTDGLYNSSQTLTSLRITTLSLCVYTNDYSWQVISPYFDEVLGFLLYKKDVVKWGYENKIPLEKTYTCLKGLDFHCGECLTCNVRKESFKEANLVDKTIYFDSKKKFFLKKIFSKLTSKIFKFFFREKVSIKDYY